MIDWIEEYGHEYAGELFEADPSKCFQRHVREMHAAADPRPTIDSLDGAVVEEIPFSEAKAIIEANEWLGDLPTRTAASYGLKINGETVAVECFGLSGSPEARQIVEPDPDHYWRDRTVCLMRGATLHFAPDSASSHAVRHACEKAHEEHGWSIFFAYSDPSASERGKIYQGANWKYLGQSIGRNANGQKDWILQDGTKVSSYWYRRKAKELGYTEEMKRLGLSMAQFLRNIGGVEVPAKPKHKWVWFEGTPAERRKLRKMCKYEFLPVPEELKRRRLASADSAYTDRN
ncbi:MAG: hypothetical protein ABSC64_03345 [Candidatus Korobacteraceae bacterium]|jgi:hypothetical protein